VPKKLNTISFIEKATKVHNNKYIYDQVCYINGRTKVKIVCSKHGVFEQIPKNHLHGRGCQKCSFKAMDIEDFIERSVKVHGNRYDYSNTKIIKRKATIYCKKHGFFNQNIHDHLNGHGCFKCFGSPKKSTEEFILEAKEIHNNKYDYSEVDYINALSKVIIICPKHGRFTQTPSAHLTGYGCIKCGHGTMTQDDFIAKSKSIHGNLYDYSLVKYKKITSKVIILCASHGEFMQRPNDHLVGRGCKKCATDSSRLNTYDFIERAKEIHNNKYDYSKTDYVSMKTKVIIICPEHGEFLQTPSNHFHYGCRKCSVSVSPISQKWLDDMGVAKDNREKSIRVGDKRFVVDGFDPETKTIYEFYGDFWHGNPKKFNRNHTNHVSKKTFGELYNNTMEREILLKHGGYKIIRIWESDFTEGCNEFCKTI